MNWSSIHEVNSFPKQGQFLNQLVLRIPEPSLTLRFDKDLAEILEFKEKVFISKSTRFFCRWVYISKSGRVKIET